MTSQFVEAGTRAAPSAGTSATTRRRSRIPARLLPLALIGLALGVTACSGGSPPPKAQAQSLISKGLMAESNGQIGPAVNDFNAAATQNPASPIAYYDLGVAYQLKLNQPAKAANEYNKALLADPNYKPALYNLAILDTKSDPQSAISLYNRLLKLNPDDPNVNFNLGLLLIGQNQTAQGQADVQKAIFLQPDLKSRLPAGVTP